MKNIKILSIIFAILLLWGCRSLKNTDEIESSNKILTAEQEEYASKLIPCELDTSSYGPIRYWLYKPAEEGENMSLIIYLHGGSGKGEDLNLITAVDGFPQYLESGELSDVDGYIIIPQVPSEQKGWVKSSEAIYELIKFIVDEFDIDESNISLTGHSMGGTGTFNIALAYPELFSRIAPLSGSIQSKESNIERLKNVPMKVFVGSADTVVPPEASIEFVAAIKEAGGCAELIEFECADHFSIPRLTYLDEDIDLIDWLLGKNN